MLTLGTIFPYNSAYSDNPRCVLELGMYANKRVAISISDADTGEPITTATVNVPEFNLPPYHVLIKTWSENEGIVPALVAAGIISEPKGFVPCGYSQAAICEMKLQGLIDAVRSNGTM